MTDLERVTAIASATWRAIATADIPKHELDDITYRMGHEGHNAAGNWHVAANFVHDTLFRYANDPSYPQRQAILDWAGQSGLMARIDALTTQANLRETELHELKGKIRDTEFARDDYQRQLVACQNAASQPTTEQPQPEPQPEAVTPQGFWAQLLAAIISTLTRKG